MFHLLYPLLIGPLLLEFVLPVHCRQCLVSVRGGEYIYIYTYITIYTYVRTRTRPRLSSFVDVYDVEQEICDGVSGRPGSRGEDACLRPAVLLQPLQN